ncbi:uncharacterized protein [Palaemon carinicauda]|uniref:uncharacterized protein n=1 Tax=Palaemon carinicauda TaxID=392227 RepID=UPI0035B59F22
MAEMQELTDRLLLEGGKVGLVINQRKTKAMQIQSGDQTNCLIGGVILPNSNSFKYLGTIINSNSKDFMERIGRVGQAIGTLKTFWRSTQISVHSKIKLYISLVRCILTYEHHSWYSTVTTDAKFLVFGNKALRRILGIKWQQHITKAAIREVAGVTKVNDIDGLSRRRWIGHILKRDEELFQDVPEWKLLSRRGRGIRRETWLMTIWRDGCI